MQTQNLGYPRISSQREFKKASEQYWQGKTTVQQLLQAGKTIRQQNWQLQKGAGIDSQALQQMETFQSNELFLFVHSLWSCLQL